MSERERTDAGTYAETVTLEAVLDVFDAVRGPVITSSDVAGHLDCTTEAARQKLTRLYDQGRVNKRKTGRMTVYWRSTPARGLGQETVDEALSGWEPDTEANAETARTQTRRAAEYLQTEGGRHTRSDLVDALAGDSSLGERSWWERAVQPGLRRLANTGAVEYREGHHDYRWIDERDR
jgi:hypothetical protein